MSDLSTYLPVNKDNEEYAISYLIKNQKEIYRTKEKFFFDPLCRILYQCIFQINDKGHKCEINILFEYAKDKSKNIEKEDIIKIINSYENFDNIKRVFKKLQDFYVSNEILKKVEVIANKSLDKNDLDKQGIKELSNLLEKDVASLGDNENLLDTKDIGKRYREEQEKRQKGERKRSLGWAELDQYVTRPASPEEITLLLGLKGFGKSAFKLCQENNLINSGICVVAFNPEMPLLSNTDRLIGIRSGIPIQELLKKEKEQQLRNQIEREIRRIENIPNYLYYEDADLNLYTLRDKIQKAKQIFSDKKVLPEDEYIFITIDTFDMLEEFEDADPRRIKANVNRFHKIIRKEGVHAEILLQANENKLRMGNLIKKVEDCDFYKMGIEDIEGGAAYAAKARLVISLNRPVQMKKMKFPERMEEWNMENDLLNVAGVKQNDGKLFFLQFSFDDNMRIRPHKKEEIQEND